MDPFEAAAAQQLGGGQQQQAAPDAFDAAATQALSQPPAPHHAAAAPQPQRQQFVPPPPPTMPTGGQVPPPGILPGAQSTPPPPPQATPATGMPQLITPPHARPPSNDQALQGNVSKWVTGLPVVGQPIANAGKAYNEFNTEGNQLSSAMAATAGALEGAGRSIEEPVAAAYGVARNAFPQLPPEPNLMGQLHDRPEMKALQKSAPGSYDTGQLAGNLLASLGEGALAEKGAITVVSRVLSKLSKVAPEAVEAISKAIQGAQNAGVGKEGSQARKISNFVGKQAAGTAKSAAEGAAFGGVQGAGERVMQGENASIKPEDLQAGATAGALLHYPVKATTKVFGNIIKKKPEEGMKAEAQKLEDMPPLDRGNRIESAQQRLDREGVPPEQPLDVEYEHVPEPPPRGLPGQTPEQGPRRLEADDQRYKATLQEFGRYPAGLRDTGAIPLRGRGAQETEPTREQVQRAEDIRSAGAPVQKTAPEPVRQPEPVKEPAKKLTEVVKPEPPQFASVQDAVDKFQNSKSEAVKDAAERYLQENFSKKKVSEVVKPEAKKLEGNVEETVMQPEEFKPKLAPFEEKFYQETGKEPLPEEKSDNTHEQRMKVPESDVMEKDPTTGKYTQPFDAAKEGPRRVFWNGRVHGAKPHPTEAGHVRVGGIIGDKGARRAQEVFDALDKGTNMADQLADAPTGLSAAQEHAHERGVEESGQGKTRQEQADAIDKIARTRAVTDAVVNNDPEALKAATKPKKNRSGIAYGGFGLQAVIDMAEQAPGAIGDVVKHLTGIKDNELVKAIPKIVNTNDTLDSIAEGADRNKSDFVDRLNGHLSQMGVDMHGADVTSGETGAKVRKYVKELTLNEIGDPANTPDLTPEQRTKAQMLSYHTERLKRLVREEIKDHPDDEKYQRALNELVGKSGGGKGEGDMVYDSVSHYLAQYALAKNPAFHGTLLTHPASMAGVAGPVNTAQAMHMMLTDPLTKKWAEGTHNTTSDWRGTFQADNALAGGKAVPKEWESSRHNNKVFVLAGMIKKAKELHGEGWRSAVDGLMERAGKNATDADGELLSEGLQTLRDATGNVPGTKNKVFTSRNQVTRTLAQMSGYKAIVDRQLVKGTKNLFSKDPEIQRQAVKRVGTLLAATVAMGGGAAAVPQEARDALWAWNPKLMYSMEYLGDHANVLTGAEKLTGHARVLEHMRLGFLNWGYSQPLAQAQHMYHALMKKDQTLAGLVATMIWEAPIVGGSPTIKGVGGAVIKRGLSNIYKAKEGGKDVSAYDPLGHQIGKGEREYGPVEAAFDMLPGTDIEEYNWKHKQYVKHMFKRAGLPPPPNLDSDYKSPHVHDKSNPKKLTHLVKKSEA